MILICIFYFLTTVHANISIRTSNDNKWNISMGYASYGHIPYGHIIEGKISYNKNNSLSCENLNDNVSENSILIADFGECSFSYKSLMAQLNKYKVLILIDDIEEDVGGIILNDDDDKNGDNVNITTICISQKDGKIIKDYINENPENEIFISINFEVEKYDGYINYTLWYFPSQENAYHFIEEFYNYHIDILPKSNFDFHFVAYPHIKYDIQEKIEYENCFAYGNYCSQDKIDTLFEAIRQKCISKISHDSYWKYMIQYKKQCLSTEVTSKNCSSSIIEELSFSNELIELCIKSSFIGKEDEKDNDPIYYQKMKNIIFEDDLSLRNKLQIEKGPALYIGNNKYLGKWDKKYILEAICASMLEKEDICYSEGLFEVQPGIVSSILKVFTFFCSFLLIIIVLFGIYRYFIIKKNKYRIFSTTPDNTPTPAYKLI